jgi:hypothetical protein
VEEELRKVVIKETESNGEMEEASDELYNKKTDPLAIRDMLLSKIK